MNKLNTNQRAQLTQALLPLVKISMRGENVTDDSESITTFTLSLIDTLCEIVPEWVRDDAEECDKCGLLTVDPKLHKCKEIET